MNLNLIFALLLALVAASFVVMNWDVPDAILQFYWFKATYQVHVPPWVLILVSALVAVLLDGIARSFRDAARYRRFRHTLTELEQAQRRIEELEAEVETLRAGAPAEEEEPPEEREQGSKE